MQIILVSLLTEKRSISLKQIIKLSTFQFYLGSISNTFDVSEEASFKNVYDFWVDYNAIDKSNILNTHKYLMVKNNRK